MQLLSRHSMRNHLGCDFIVGGSSAVADAGWTTQIQRMPEILVRGRTTAVLTGARIRCRGPEHFDMLLNWCCPMGHSETGWPVLLPEMAIADALADRSRGGATHIFDADDLDPDEMGDGAGEALLRALRDIDADPQSIGEALDPYLDVLSGRSAYGMR
ncbi:hypothetical protein [Leisingera caerulea]|uniref:hypothetical protein n=1 Tax=Leisingera caerulea TaxID=506591 RepID=UPI0012B64A43|nr:hypothetical protein [Leisingera caerulea]